MADAVDHRLIYVRQAEEYDLLVSREDYQGHILPALASIRPWAGLEVVELGAGTGRLTRLLGPKARNVLALDLSAHMLAEARPTLSRAGLDNCRLIQGDGRHLPLASRVADLVIAGWTFGHFVSWYRPAWRQEVERAVAEMLRALRPGGTAVILETLGTGRTTPRPPTKGLAAYYALLENQLGFSLTWIRTDYRFCSLAEAERLIRFFFGPQLASQVTQKGEPIVPECTGLWWRTT